MPGTKEGGLAARDQNLRIHGKDFYKRIGAKGGRVRGIKKGFALNQWCDNPCKFDKSLGDHRVAQCAGTKGGTKSRR